MNRRVFLGQSSVALSLAFGVSVLARAALSQAKIIVVGGGLGGATAAKYLRLLSNHTVSVTLIEPNAQFVSTPLSNLVVGGSKTLAELTVSYATLQKKYGIKVVQDRVVSFDRDKKTVRLTTGQTLPYDKLVLSPGMSLVPQSIEGLAQANQAGITLQAWKAGAETVALRQQLTEMKDGGVYALSIPLAPYGCAPAPYERACLVASYFKKYKPKSKVIVLDANEEVTSNQALFKRVWAEQYPELLEYRPQFNVTAIDAQTKTLKFDVQEDLQAEVLNVLPEMRAGTLAVAEGLANANKRWVQVDFKTFEATAAKDIHVLGDAIQIEAAMPKSGHMANQHGKVTAAAIVAQLAGIESNFPLMLTNACYSFVNEAQAIHVASVHQYDALEKIFKPVAGSGGVSVSPTELEGAYAWGWARNIWADSLG